MVLSWLITKPIAHRGLHTNNSLIPENSLLAFGAAIDKGFPIELDVHVIADGTVIVFHDDDLNRMCGIDRDTKTLTFNELSKIFLNSSKETIPSLDAVLKLINGQVPVLIEIKKLKKPEDEAERIYDILRKYQYEFAIQSFSPLTLRWFKRHAPQICRGQLSSSFRAQKISFFAKFVLRNYLCNFISKPDFIAHDIEDLPSRFTTVLRRRGMTLLGWTVKSEAQLELAYCYCDNIIFEGFNPN